MALTGTQTYGTASDANGYYNISGVTANGSYTVTASKAGYNLSGGQTFNNVTSNQTANFTAELAQYVLTTAVNPPGAGTVTAGGTYAYGSTVTLSAAAASGYQFSNFSGSANGISNPFTVTISGPMTVTANFTQAPAQYQLTTSVSPVGSGTILPGCTGGCSFSSGTISTLIATPATGYRFTGFTGSVNSSSNPLFITMNGAMTLTAHFTANYTISGQVTRSGSGAGVSAVNVSVNGSQDMSVMTDASGMYSVPDLASGGTYSIAASKNGYILSSPHTVTNLSSNQTMSFTATPTISINGGGNTAGVAAGTNVPISFNFVDAAGANDIAWAQFQFADSSGNPHCLGDWGRPNGLNLYDGNTGATWGFGINQSDGFCTVSLTSVSNSATDTTQLSVALNFNFSAGHAGTYTVLTQVNYGTGDAGPWQALGTLTLADTGNVIISGHISALNYPLGGTTLTLGGSASAVTTTDSSGAYTFIQPAGGNYSIQPIGNGLVFSPPALSWNNLTTSITGDFTALPSGFTDGTGPASIPNSYTAPDPVVKCDDISGAWADDLGNGNEIGWSLRQTGTSISGFMAFKSFEGNNYCGTVNYGVTGSYDASAGAFSLSATVQGAAHDACNTPVVSSWTEKVILSGRTCGTASGQSSASSVFSTAVRTAAPTSLSTSRISRAWQQPDPVDSHSRQATIAASTGADRTRQAQSNTNWTTLSPRFTIQYSSFIPVDRMAGPLPCLLTLEGQESFAAGWLTYKGDANRGTYRTTESLLVVPDAQKYGNLFARGGPTRNYALPSSPANGSSSNLSSTPTGDPWRDPYSGADEDENRYDCRLWNNKGEDPNDEMLGFRVTFGNPITVVTLYGFGKNILEPSLFGLQGIKWNLNISLDITNPASPKAWVSGGTATCYPEHIVKVNGVQVFDQPPVFPNSTAYLTACLSAPGLPVAPSQPTAVPPR